MSKVPFLRNIYTDLQNYRQISLGRLEQLIKDYVNDPNNRLQLTKKGKKAENSSNVKNQILYSNMNDKNFIRALEVTKVKKFKITFVAEYEDGGIATSEQEYNLIEDKPTSQALFAAKDLK